MTSENRPGETIDVTVARKIGNNTRFRSLSATATGDVRNSFSYENGNSVNAPEWSPLRFYQRLFGTDFQDPNASKFLRTRTRCSFCLKSSESKSSRPLYPIAPTATASNPSGI